MAVFKRVVVAVLAGCVVGCAALREAREAKDAAAPRARDDAPRTPGATFALGARSLADLVAFAQTNRPSVAAKELAVRDARLALWQTWEGAPLLSEQWLRSPYSSVRGGYDASSAAAPARDLDWDTEGDPSASVSISVTLYDFGRFSAREAAAREAVIASEMALENERCAVFYDVSTAYFTFVEKAALLAVAHTNEAEFAAHLEQAEGLAQAGEAKRLDVLKARLNLASARESTVTASNAVACAGVELARVLGLESDALSAADLATLATDALERPRRAFGFTTASDDALFALARTNAPAMRVARAQLRGAREDVNAAIADLLPEVSASANLSWVNPLWMWSWGVEAAESLFYGFDKSRTLALQRSVVALEQAAVNVDALEQQCSSDVATAVSVRDNAREKIATSAAALGEAKENLATVREEYAVGTANRIDYAAAVSAYVTELGNHIQAFYVAQLAEAALFKLTGRAPVYQEGIAK